MKRWLLLVLLLIVSMSAKAYNGPGSGVSFIAALWSLIIGFLVVLSAILLWPIRVMLKRRKAKQQALEAKAESKPE